MMRLGELINIEAVDRELLIQARLDGQASSLRITGLTADSREVQPGNLFVALSGVVADGHKFIQNAIENGAVAILVADDSGFDESGTDLPVIRSSNARRALALMAARFYPRQPETIVAITGTAGKTSVANFVAQIFKSVGLKAASVGTLGVLVDGQTHASGLTTPDPVALHKTLDKLARDGVTHVAMEASSHGLDQHRLDGVRLAAGAFTNLGRDHMDYHDTKSSYFSAKARLMNELLPEGAPFIANTDAPHGEKAARLAGKAKLRVMRIGRDIKLRNVTMLESPKGPIQAVTVSFFGNEKHFNLPLPGAFQLENALTAAGLAIACRVDETAVFNAIAKLKGVPGRLEPVDMQGHKGQIYIDYAHKPDALATTLDALRPYTKRLLIAVFGAGGDRDKGKRRLMGKIADEKADLVIITDDNPRTEKPETIRKSILKAAPHAIEVADRAKAIGRAVDVMQDGDVLVVAGKGHENGQYINGKVVPFSDHEEVGKALAFKGKNKANISKHIQKNPVLWTRKELEAAVDGRLFGEAAQSFSGVSIDTRTVETGDIFFAIKGENFDGHDFVANAFRAGATLAVVSEDRLPALGRTNGSFYVVSDVLEALCQLGRAARLRANAKVIAVTGSVGKTSTKEMLALGLSASGRVHAAMKSYNNHWGVPLTLARMPANTEFGVFEIGMNHAGEIEPLSKMVKPHVALISNVAPVHLEAFKNVGEIAKAKAEIFTGVVENGKAILNVDNEHFKYLKSVALKAKLQVLTFGFAKNADGRLEKHDIVDGMANIDASIGGQKIKFMLPTIAPYLATNAISALLGTAALNCDVEKAAAALSAFNLLEGRGAQHILPLQQGSFILIDESYNANPTSVSASISLFKNLNTNGKKILVLGDMLELGDTSPELHASLKGNIQEAGVDQVHLCGPLMKNLWENLPQELQGQYAVYASDLLAPLIKNMTDGDVVMVKGSLGMGMGSLVQSLTKIYSTDPSE